MKNEDYVVYGINLLELSQEQLEALKYKVSVAINKKLLDSIDTNIRFTVEEFNDFVYKASSKDILKTEDK